MVVFVCLFIVVFYWRGVVVGGCCCWVVCFFGGVGGGGGSGGEVSYRSRQILCKIHDSTENMKQYSIWQLRT